MEIAIGSDHAGYELKEKLKTWLKKRKISVQDFGTHSPESMDYPDVAHPLAGAIENGVYPFGILICGTANGVAYAANRHKGVRCAVCWSKPIAVLARQHNNANIIGIPARFVSVRTATAMLEAFLNTPFEGGRHAPRVDKIEKGG